MLRSASLVSLSVAALALTGCVSDPVDPVVEPGTTSATLSTDTLRYDIDPAFAGRVLLIDWYHVSFSSPLAVRTLATRPVAQAVALSGATGVVALPSTVDSLFEFYARCAQYAADEAAGEIKQNFVDSAAWYQSHRRWAIAPLVVVRTTEMASMTLAQMGAGNKPQDAVSRGAGYVLFWTRDSILAEQDGLLKRRKLSGWFKPGWHLLRYNDADRSLEARPFSDTLKFRADAPRPNLV